MRPFADAERAHDERRFADAARILEGLLAAHGEGAPPQVYQRLAEAYRWLGRLTDAEATASAGRALYAHDPHLRRAHAEVASVAGDWPTAIGRWDALIEIAGASASAPAFRRLAVAHRARRDLGTAAEVISNGLRRHPHDIRLEVEAAELATYASDWDHAVRRWQAILNRHGADAFARLGERLATTTRRRDLVRRSLEIARRDKMLCRGWFVSEGTVVWRHWRTSLPEHVRKTRPGREVRRALRSVTRLPDRIALAIRSFRRGFLSWSDGQERFDVVIAASDGGCVLVDTRQRRVARNVGDKPVTQEQIALREQWARHVPSPGFRVHENGRWLVEELVDGVPITSLDTTAQLEALKRLMMRYAALVRDEGRPPPVADQLDARTLAACPPALATLVRKLDTDAWPQVPSSGDPDPKNLIVTPNGTAMVIDVMPMAWRTFARDALCLIGRFGHAPRIRAAYVDGAFDRELEELLGAAGVTAAVDDTLRLGVMAHVLLQRASDEARRRGGFDRTLLGHRVTAINAWLSGAL